MELFIALGQSALFVLGVLFIVFGIALARKNTKTSIMSKAIAYNIKDRYSKHSDSVVYRGSYTKGLAVVLDREASKKAGTKVYMRIWQSRPDSDSWNN